MPNGGENRIIIGKRSQNLWRGVSGRKTGWRKRARKSGGRREERSEWKRT